MKKGLHIPDWIINAVTGCSFLSATGSATVNGDTIIGRNFDWMTNLYDNKDVLCLHFVQDGIMSFTFPGMVFCTLTAVNKHKVWCSFNNLSYSVGVSLAKDLPTITTDMHFRLKNSTSASELHKEFKDATFDISIMYFTADSNGAYCVAQKPKVRKITEGSPSDTIFARANKVINPAWYKEGIADPNGWASDSLHRYCVMMKQLHDNEGSINDKTIMHILQESHKGPTLYKKKGKNEDHTIYQVVYNANTHKLYIRGYSPLSPTQLWYHIPI